MLAETITACITPHFYTPARGALQGDFVRALLDAAQPELDKPARDVSQYTLQGHLDAALRASSVAGEDPGLLRRVDVRLPPGKALEGDTGWDVFSLQVRGAGLG